MNRDTIELDDKCVLYPDEMSFQTINPACIRKAQQNHGVVMTFNLNINSKIVGAISSSIKTFYRHQKLNNYKYK